MIYYLLDWIGDNLKKKSFNRSRRRLLVFGTLLIIYTLLNINSM